MIDSFHWLRPWWLMALLPLLPFLWLRLKTRTSGSDWHKVCDPQLLPHLTQSVSAHASDQMPYRMIFIAFLTILALAGPVWQRLPQPVWQKQTSLVLILDLSLSMDATDIKPSRLERAKLKIADLLKRHREGTIALTTFAGDSFVVTPLTSDTETITAHLQALTTDIMPALGSRPDLGIHLAEKILQQASVSGGEALLITDGEVSKATQEAANQFRDHGHRLSVLGVGTPEGAPIPIKQGGFLKDSQGGIVIPKLEELPLRQLALKGGGVYATMQADDRDLDLLMNLDVTHLLDNKTKASDLTADIWYEEGPWLLLVVLPLAAMGFRRGVLGGLMILSFSQPVMAMDWDALWQRPDQQAARQLEAGNPAGAAYKFTDPAWKAAALYRSGQFEEAVQTLNQLDSADAWYNKGNALARLNRFQDALQAYEEALKRNPQHKDALYNQELVKKQLPSPPPSQSQDKPDDKKSPEKKPEEKQQEAASQDKGQEEEKSSQSESKEQKQDNQEAKETKETKEAKDAEESKEAQEAKEAKEAQEAKEAKEEKETKETKEAQINDQPPVEKNESQLADEQWLKRIPDDPGGLLRRKFLYQYQQQGQTRHEEKSW